MELSRRKLLAVGAGGLAGALGFGGDVPKAQATPIAPAGPFHRISTTICPYCAVGCGAVVFSKNLAEKDHLGRRRVVTHVEGDPDHPINEGALCPKGAGIYQLANNEHRLTHVLHRKPGAKDFTRISWKDAAKRIARLIKNTRDATFCTKNERGQTVNRTTAIASLGSAAMDNEECWLYQSMLRAMGLVYIEHQARL